MRSLLASTIHIVHLLHPGSLTGGELCIAVRRTSARELRLQVDVDLPHVIAIIHIVMDTVKTSLVRAAIFATWAPTSCSRLDRSIADRVASTRAALTLKDVEETEPVPNLMSRATALIVVGSSATRD